MISSFGQFCRTLELYNHGIFFTICTPLNADLFIHCYESQYMASLCKDASKSDLMDKFNSTYRYHDNIFALNNINVSRYVTTIYPRELTLNKANQESSSWSFLLLDISTSQSQIKTKNIWRENRFLIQYCKFSLPSKWRPFDLIIRCIYLSNGPYCPSTQQCSNLY